jgi:hypothetical protein
MHKTALALVAGVLLVVSPSHAQQATTKDQPDSTGLSGKNLRH